MAFGATELDRVLMEEQVKVEKKMRMVLDVDTDDMVTLGEFETRTKLRCQIKEVAGAIGIESGAGGRQTSTASATTSGDGKRKHDEADAEEEHDEKRTRL